MGVDKLIRGAADRFYRTVHYAGAGYACQQPLPKAAAIAVTEPNASLKERLSYTQRIDALWRNGVLRGLVLASAMRGVVAPDSDSDQVSPHALVVDRFNPIAEVSRNAFLSRFAQHTPDEQARVRRAYDLGLAAHGEQTRDSKTPYFEHPKRVALILSDECGITDPTLIAAALLHDAVEDTALFGLTQEEARATLAWYLGEETAAMVIALTKQSAVEKRLTGGTRRDRQAATDEYIQQLIDSPYGTVLIKMADRLHNLMTMQSLSDERRSRMKKETEGIYLPLFRQAESRYRDRPLFLDASRLLIQRMEIILAIP